MASVTDFTIVCGLSVDGGLEGNVETDWQHFGIPVKANETWEFQCQCCHAAGAPNATVVGAFVAYDSKGLYRATMSAPAPVLTDSTSWQRYSFQTVFANDLYVFPALWFHAATALQARYVAAAQMAKIG